MTFTFSSRVKDPDLCAHAHADAYRTRPGPGHSRKVCCCARLLLRVHVCEDLCCTRACIKKMLNSSSWCRRGGRLRLSLLLCLSEVECDVVAAKKKPQHNISNGSKRKRDTVNHDDAQSMRYTHDTKRVKRRLPNGTLQTHRTR